VRVATTKHGNRLHLIDPNTSDVKDQVTSCGRRKISWVNIQRPVKGQVCQTCVRTALARMTRLLFIKDTKIGGDKPGKRKIRPSQSSSLPKPKVGKGRRSRKSPRFVED